MILPYTPATEKQLTEMNYEQLLIQYQSLADLLKETRGIPFERTPSCEKDELARLIWEGQVNNMRAVLAGSLIAWGDRKGMLDKPILYIEESTCPCSQRGQ